MASGLLVWASSLIQAHWLAVVPLVCVVVRVALGRTPTALKLKLKRITFILGAAMLWGEMWGQVLDDES